MQMSIGYETPIITQYSLNMINVQAGTLDFVAYAHLHKVLPLDPINNRFFVIKLWKMT